MIRGESGRNDSADQKENPHWLARVLILRFNSTRYSVLLLPSVVAALVAGPVALAIGVLERLPVAGSAPTMLGFLVVVALCWAEAVMGGLIALAISVAVLVTGVVGGIVVLRAAVTVCAVGIGNSWILVRVSRILSRVAAAPAIVIVTLARGAVRRRQDPSVRLP